MRICKVFRKKETLLSQRRECTIFSRKNNESLRCMVRSHQKSSEGHATRKESQEFTFVQVSRDACTMAYWEIFMGVNTMYSHQRPMKIRGNHFNQSKLKKIDREILRKSRKAKYYRHLPRAVQVVSSGETQVSRPSVSRLLFVAKFILYSLETLYCPPLVL